MGYILALTSALGYSLHDIFMRLGMRYGKAYTSQSMLINLVAGNLALLFVGVLFFIYNGLPKLTLLGMAYFVVAGIFAPFLGRVFTISAIRLIGVTRTNTLRVSDAFFTMPLAIIILGDTLSLGSILGAIILVTGTIVLINEPSPTTLNDNYTQANHLAALSIESQINQIGKCMKLLFNSHGAILALMSAFCYAFGGILRQLGLKHLPSPLLGGIISSMIALLTNTVYSCYTGHLQKNTWSMTKREVLFYVLGGVTGTIGLTTTFFALQSGAPVITVAALKNTTPLFTLAISWLFLGKIERVTLKLILSLITVVIGAWLIVNR